MSAIASAQPLPPDTLWTHTYGGTGEDYGLCVQKTSDGGFITVGVFGGEQSDIYLLKTDEIGVEQWHHIIPNTVEGHYVQQTTDGGYIIVGHTHDYGNEGQVYLHKTDSNGNELWHRTFGYSYDDDGWCVQQTSDGGYIITGWCQINWPNYQIYLLKTDALGNPLWQTDFGGAQEDRGWSVRQTSDGGYILVGRTYSYGAGYSDIWLIKTSSFGDLIWQRTYGGTGIDEGYDISICSDGGFIITGYANSYPPSYFGDVYTIRTNSLGDTIWTAMTGGNEDDGGNVILQTSDGGYIVGGCTHSFGSGPSDMYIIKYYPNGSVEWTKCVGGDNHEWAQGLDLTNDGGYIFSGLTSSYGINGDLYLVRLEGPEIITVTLTPHNPPITIPAAGGSFQFDVDINNTGTTNYLIDFWTSVTNPSGTQYPILIRNGLNLAAGAAISRDNLTQMVPGTAAAGTYSYNAYVRDHSTWETLAEDSFPFTKLPGETASAHNEGWACYGWDEETDSTFSLSPLAFSLEHPSPNPFNPSTTLSYSLPISGEIALTIYDLQGREVCILYEGYQAAGNHQAVFDGSQLASGIYFAVLQAGKLRQAQKLVLIK